jgi:hypothetical protein
MKLDFGRKSFFGQIFAIEFRTNFYN